MKGLLSAIAALLVSSMLTSTAAQAGEDVARWASWATVGGWQVDGSDNGCRVMGLYGDTVLAFTFTVDGFAKLWIGNPDWAARFPKGATVGVDITSDGGRWPAAVASAYADGGLMIDNLDEAAVVKFMDARHIGFAVQDMQLGRFRLDASGRATAEAIRCTLAIREANASKDSEPGIYASSF